MGFRFTRAWVYSWIYLDNLWTLKKLRFASFVNMRSELVTETKVFVLGNVGEAKRSA